MWLIPTRIYLVEFYHKIIIDVYLIDILLEIIPD